MTEFTKTKMHFALALLGTLFALHPFLEKIEDAGFTYFKGDINNVHVNIYLKHFYVYALIAGLLALAVYFYAVALLSERPSARAERVGNYLYAFAIIVLPLYGALYLSSLIAQRLEGSRFELAVRAAPFVAVGLAVLWLALSWLFAWRLRRRLGEQDRTAKMQNLAAQEIDALGRAREMFASHHYDLSVIEAWKAIEARLRRVLLRRGVGGRAHTTEAMLRAATKAGLLEKRPQELLHHLREQWNVAVGTDPLTRDAAESALAAARDILATIAVEPPGKTPKPLV